MPLLVTVSEEFATSMTVMCHVPDAMNLALNVFTPLSPLANV